MLSGRVVPGRGGIGPSWYQAEAVLGRVDVDVDDRLVIDNVWHTLESYLGRFIDIGSITEINLQDTNR